MITALYLVALVALGLAVRNAGQRLGHAKRRLEQLRRLHQP